MKLKAFVLTAGLIALGANAAWASTGLFDPGPPYSLCKTNLDGQVRSKGDQCTSKSYKFNKDKSCKCPTTIWNKGIMIQQGTTKCLRPKTDLGNDLLNSTQEDIFACE